MPTENDDINTPEDLAQDLVQLRTLTWDLSHTLGEKQLFPLIKQAKEEVFNTEAIKRLDEGHKTVLTDILRWHFKQGLESPPRKRK